MELTNFQNIKTKIMQNWKAQTLKHGVRIKGEHGEEIAICLTHMLGEPTGYLIKEAEANAKLMAAAPFMIEALKNLHRVVMLSNDKIIFDNGKNAETVAKAWEAIQKANN